jgi:hypothetical protein
MVFISNRKLHVSAYSGHHHVLTTFLLEELYIIRINRVSKLKPHHHHSRAFVKLSLVGCLLREWIYRYLGVDTLG